ncbi:MAG: archaeal proteasome endopeptidase complex subunit alpha [Candidatus Nitrosoabyssus spongiisocia]|nr:MAG: archaeal proteasome endopeptidase complex subunit alpha [Nitrosopumilaceae archaeon AB1(1)]
MMTSRGYDMTPTMYSPDGRIYQVEYALETVKRGTLALGIKSNEGVIMAVEEKSRTLQSAGITQKIFNIDDHIGAAAAGYIPDARVQIDNARNFSQGNEISYDEQVDVEVITKHLADQCHQFTQYAGVRPYGVALIIAGIDQNGKSIYLIDPSGTYVQYSAISIGAGSDNVNDFLEKKFTSKLSQEDATILAIAAINAKSDDMLDHTHVKISEIRDKGVINNLSVDKIEKYLKMAVEKYPKT